MVDWKKKEVRGLEGEACKRFNEGWTHFLKCMDLGRSSMDQEAIGWMNDISIIMRKVGKIK